MEVSFINTPLLTKENPDKHTTHILGCVSVVVLYCFLILRVAWNVAIEVYNHRASLTQNCEQNKIFRWLSSKSLLLNFHSFSFPKPQCWYSSLSFPLNYLMASHNGCELGLPFIMDLFQLPPIHQNLVVLFS